MLADFFDRIGNNFQKNFDAAGPEGLASLGAAIASAPRNQWGAGLAQGLAGFKQAAAANKKKASLAEALKGAMGQYTPEQQAFLGALEPDQAAGILGGNMFPKSPTEKWVDLGNGKQQNVITGKVDDIPLSLDDRKALAAAGRSNVTVNNLPPELGARTAMGEGFTADYENIRERVKKFYSGGAGGQAVRRGQMLFNTGEGGKLWADVETGKEALVRTLTGAGMAQAEAENQASRYGLSPYDTEFDALQKIERLQRDLNNVARGAYGARGREYVPPASADNYSDVDAILGLK